ncbi:uncharacterized protein At4g15545-like isoform X1 [Henckelia pumila]|uniref:uncharacterized protein At4g15545-like isoform X1 n=1 Tax=Henckelia pumila TaxID=405737 RepID=UPI003C6E8D92
MAANGGGDGIRVGPHFGLPEEIQSVLPTDPYDQLDLARKITSMAIASRVTKLETEADLLQQQLVDKDQAILVLEDKVSQLENANQEIELRLKITRGENIKLLKERDSLAFTAEKLSQHLAKLQNFKRQLMQSLNDDSFTQTETVDICTYEQSVPKAYATNGNFNLFTMYLCDTSNLVVHAAPVRYDDDSNGYRKHHSFGTSNDSASVNDIVVQQAKKLFSSTPNETPRFTPTGTPHVFSSNASPKRYSAASSPHRTSGTTSPTTQGSTSLSLWYPSSQQSSGTNSPTLGHPLPARPPRITGKELFPQARKRLSLGQFSAFLANVKEFNAQKQSREETLRKAEEIFGIDNKDLYALFQGLLSHSIH